eukprot:2113104-Amphidinium_carterae.1
MVALEGGFFAWFYADDLLLSLVAHCVVDVAEQGFFPRDVADADSVDVRADCCLVTIMINTPSRSAREWKSEQWRERKG